MSRGSAPVPRCTSPRSGSCTSASPTSAAPRRAPSAAWIRRPSTICGRRTRKRLRNRLGELEEALAQGDPLEPAAAHRIRIAAKKLRYDAELLRDAFHLSGAIEVLSQLQSVLGELHDADVRLEGLR